VRAGGKHNDLDNVGYTARHHTFFEMLGNFSFGDYFKQQAIEYAWEFLTKVLNIPQEKLWVTVHKEDKEAEDIWFNHIGINQTRFSRLDDKDNFWSMGDTGPCGPCSEIFYDHGESVAGGPPGSPDEDGDRYIEIWNLVFMQFNRSKNGEVTPLPKPSVDTGMGLERIAAVMQDVHSNYEIDLFDKLIRRIATTLKIDDLSQQSLRVIADHIRSCSFLILDGVLPGNEGRGYVLRRIIRRAVRHGNKLGAKTNFFHQFVSELVEQMGDAYPGLRSRASYIEEALLKEEQQFARTLEQGMKILEQDIQQLDANQISGETLFKLYDTYGFPVDLTADIAREKNLTIDEQGFQRCMDEQKERGRKAGKFGADYNDQLSVEGTTEFLGYELSESSSKVVQIFVDAGLVDAITAGAEAQILLDKTPFYAESGGQVGDKGLLVGEGFEFQVEDTVKVQDAFLHIGKMVSGTLQVNESVEAKIKIDDRKDIASNHSATHLMHAALRKVLGEHVEQKGSLVDSERLRFDFSHPEAVSQDSIFEIERLVNQQIRENHLVETQEVSMQKAKELGAMMLFGEKYGESVRVLSMSDFSVELCGGTHVKQTGEIGAFKITSEQGIASGVRRIEAVTGQQALDYTQKESLLMSQLAQVLKTDKSSIDEKLEQLINRAKQQDKEIEQLKNKLSSSQSADLLDNLQTINGISLLVAKVEASDVKALRNLNDQLKSRLTSGILVLAAEINGKISLIVSVTKDLVDRFHAGKLMQELAKLLGGKGGGRPDMAQGGGTDIAQLDSALNWVSEYVGEQSV
jgi:alanyl-tRNA synthetase